MKERMLAVIIFTLAFFQFNVSVIAGDDEIICATRGDVADIIVIEILRSNPDIIIPENAEINEYADINDLNPAWLPRLEFLLKNEIILGYGDGLLRLDQNISRLEVALMISRSEKFFSKKQAMLEYVPYEDVPQWGEEAVRYCFERGLMIGYGNLFGANDYITNEQVKIISTRMKNGLSTIERLRLEEAFGLCNLRISEALKTADDPAIAFDKTLEGNERYTDSLDQFNRLEMFNKVIDCINSFDYRYSVIEEKLKVFDTMYLAGEESIKESNRQYLNKLKDDYFRQDVLFVSSENNGGAYTTYPEGGSRCNGYLYFICYQGNIENLVESPLFKTDTSNDMVFEHGKWYRRTAKVAYWGRLANGARPSNYFACSLGPIEPVPDELLYNPQ